MKDKDMREMKDEEFVQKLKNAREELFNLRFQHATGQLDNPMKLRHLRRKIARILTVQHEYQLKQQERV